MKKVGLIFCSFVLALSGCARNMSSDVYSSTSSLSLTMEGKIINVRPITITDSDKLGKNVLGGVAGGALGGAGASGIGGGSGNSAAIIGGVIIGSVIGALVESELGKQDGFEYIVKLDTSKLKDGYYEGSGAMRAAISTATTNGLITVIQGNDVQLQEGQKVYAIMSDKRTRLIAQ